jgi:two-component sensor histidine kinase
MERLLYFLPERPQPASIRYGSSAVMAVLAVLLQSGVREQSGFSGFFLLIPPVLLAGLLFDRGSSFVALLVGMVLSLWLVTPHAGYFPDIKQLIPLVLFVLVSAFVGIFAESFRKSLERAAEQKHFREAELREISHRTKNDLAAVAALLRLHARSTTNEEARNVLRDAEARVQVLSEVHSHLSATGKHGTVMIRDYLQELCGKVVETLRDIRPIVVRVAVDPLELPVEVSVPIGIIVNELLTNAFKYAFPGGRMGGIDVVLKKNGDLVLTVRDDGVGCAADSIDGLGTTLMKLMAAQVGGVLRREDAKPGCRVTLRIPLKE